MFILKHTKLTQILHSNDMTSTNAQLQWHNLVGENHITDTDVQEEYYGSSSQAYYSSSQWHKDTSAMKGRDLKLIMCKVSL